MEITLHLPEQKFSDTPTKTQLTNLLNDLIKFQNACAGSLLAKSEYSITDEGIGLWLNAIVGLQRAKDAFEGKSVAGMPQPQPGPQPVRR